MTLLPLFQWFEATTLGTAVRESLWLFPAIQCGHLLALALLGGTVLVLDLRLLGLGLHNEPVPELARKVHPWMAGALIAIVATGIPMFLSESLKCYYSPPFWYKMTLLAMAVVFAFTVRRRVVAGPPRTVLYRVTGVVSLTLWFGVGFSGRWIAFY
jgi:hypothetical protein